MSTSHERKSLIPDETPKTKSGKSTGGSSDGSGKIRVIAMTSLFVILLAVAAYLWFPRSESIPQDEPAAPDAAAQPGKPSQPQPAAPPPPELQRERHDVIQG